jgi:hypothetical protein
MRRGETPLDATSEIVVEILVHLPRVVLFWHDLSATGVRGRVLAVTDTS